MAPVPEDQLLSLPKRGRGPGGKFLPVAAPPVVPPPLGDGPDVAVEVAVAPVGVDLSGYLSIEQQVLAPVLPVITDARGQGAIVVYLGAGDRYSCAKPGKVVRDSYEIAPNQFEDRYSVSEAGMENHVFESRDLIGRLIPSRIVGNTATPAVQGRPFCRCAHPEHLRLFMREVDEAKRHLFRLFIPPEANAAFSRYVQEKERGMREQQQFEEDLVRNAS